MATDSFADINQYDWLPITAYQTILSLILAEVEQGLWANSAHPDDWCCINTSPPHGVNNSWVTYTYQLISDITQALSLVWPAGWSPPAENINGELPSHFFAGATTSMPTGAAPTAQPFHETYAAPATQPAYKSAGLCV